MDFRTLNDMDFEGKRVIVRAGLDVPLDEHCHITDDNRLQHAKDTIKYLLEKGAKQIIVMGHLHRPGGKVVEELRLNPVASRLSELIEVQIHKVDDCIDIELPNKRVIMLENLRFHKEEKENYEFFAKKLAAYADIYVNDCFSTTHREHASIVGVPHYIPSCAGLTLENEMRMLTQKLDEPERPFVAIMGGAKVSGKINVINSLLQKVDKLILGGAMIFTFYKAQGLEIGQSLYEEDKVELAKLMMHNEKLVLPTDVKVAAAKEAGAEQRNVSTNEIPHDWFGLDIGDESINHIKDIIANAKTVVWNGPMGLFEIDDFAHGTEEVARALADLDGTTIVGGGDSDAALKKLGLVNKMTHVSTGGGASLKLLEGKELAGITALKENKLKFP